ncbi:hypothetical protein DPEC_G00267540 [Dallia pectoralis]|uniref:Uncharacterized protein n=1 Tax=Dallia pectoralis TaxID=75939 RepID=A0ACC2FNN4_DALPE|nr:hypothetical protein DPEC_G00267540 [Dallia pectoralis]
MRDKNGLQEFRVNQILLTVLTLLYHGTKPTLTRQGSAHMSGSGGRHGPSRVSAIPEPPGAPLPPSSVTPVAGHQPTQKLHGRLCSLKPVWLVECMEEVELFEYFPPLLILRGGECRSERGGGRAQE